MQVWPKETELGEGGEVKVWVFLESLKPLRWCVRFGKKWKIVKSVSIEIPMKTARGKIAPHGYLVGDGTVSIRRCIARIGGLIKPDEME